MSPHEPVATRDLTLAGPHGPLPVRLYQSLPTQQTRSDAPVARTPVGLVWCHGGAFVHGDLDMPEGDWVARSLAARGITVLSVDYHLVPRHAAEGLPTGVAGTPDDVRFPVPSHDVEFALGWLREHAAELSVDPERVALGGASAGGNLATGVALRLGAGASETPDGGTAPRVAASYTETPTAPPALLVLAYPTLHARQPPLAAELRAALEREGYLDHLSPTLAQGMYENYLGYADGTRASLDAAPLDAVPGLAAPSDLAGLPPVVMVTSEADGLRASADAFAATLRAAGVSLDAYCEPGTGHGHLNTPDHPGAAQTLDRFAAALLALAPTQKAHP
ncbi:alpha/beta hydrolase fold domain-containing protein [Micrococcales bacterium 31B]|nr:alpha/beta hydrolase fold domain-containing protein [Micrococcales bacterium 31B]